MQLLHLFCATCILASLSVLYFRATPILQREYSLPVHQTLYLDAGLTEEEKSDLIWAALTWQTATQGLVQYHLVISPNPSIKTKHPTIIISVSSYFPMVIVLDQESGNDHLGYYYQHGSIPYIALVKDRLNTDNRKVVCLHELGHDLGLDHSKEPDTIMYSTIELDADHITYSDLEQFCKLYGCQADQLYHQ